MKRYYSRLSRLSVLIFAILLFVYGGIAILALRRSDYTERKQSYEIILSELSNRYLEKQDGFYRVFLPFFESENTELISQIMNGITLDRYQNLNFINDYKKLMRDASRTDSDIRAILVKTPQDETALLYVLESDAVFRLYAKELLHQGMNDYFIGRMNYGSMQLAIKQGIIRTSLPTSHYYAIAGSMGYGNPSASHERINILTFYSTTAFDSILSRSSATEETLFQLYSEDGSLVFDSLARSRDKLSTDFISGLKDNREEFLSGKEYSVFTYSQIDGIEIAQAFVPDKLLKQTSTSSMLVLLLSIVISTLLIAFLLSVSNRFVYRRFYDLEKGMERIGSNHLEYRIPVDTRNDEFTRIVQKFNSMGDELTAQIEKTYLFAIREKSAEFHALQTSMNPHFLYNTLEAIRGKLYDSGNYESAEMIVLLSKLFKYQIKGDRFVRIGEEINMLQLYADFFQLRYDGRFMFSINVDDNIRDYAIPKYILQPILENYFIHGMQAGDNNNVRIEGRLSENDIYINIIDDGRGILADELQELNNRILNIDFTELGLVNVHARIQTLFGEDYGLQIESAGLNQGTHVTVKLQRSSIEDLRRSRQNDNKE